MKIPATLKAVVRCLFNWPRNKISFEELCFSLEGAHTITTYGLTFVFVCKWKCGYCRFLSCVEWAIDKKIEYQHSYCCGEKRAKKLKYCVLSLPESLNIFDI